MARLDLKMRCLVTLIFFMATAVSLPEDAHTFDAPSQVPKSQNELYFANLLQQRIVFVEGKVEDDMANDVVQQLLYLNAQSSTEPIHMYITSSGGDVYAGLGIYDIMQHIDAPVHTFCVGKTAEEVEVAGREDNFMSPEEAKDFGIIDVVL
ncbi:hypothetical protein CYMTET_33857 [Cymbomonas tetramitiformis]|uniref:ATP-dependent Clp protease proteolytic subunit n=1 Tax=Cymbomonas tetramitiformis TaxID=36881 RepID=A0AAE0KQG4_9CHLO|nr:hypothetical protein CYMTET_33857 [Cymbomonas tetramitiformis]